MVAKRKRAAGRTGTDKPIDWDNPEIMLFAGDEALPVGAIRQDSLSEIAGSIFGKKKEDVEAEWQKIIGQISALINTGLPLIKNFDEITFQLGFSAEGHIVFVAKAGIKTTISAKFKRKSKPAEKHEHVGVAVGTRISPRPPHRSRRALLTHRAPPSGQTSAPTRFETGCAPAHSRQSDRRGISAQCPNHGRLSAVSLG
jgi:hypothetical protein